MVMKKNRTKPEMLESMARHALQHGLNSASLRPLAKAAGTSDRMLIYHFGSKEGLVRELLLFLANDLAARLDKALPKGRAKNRHACIAEIVALLRTEPFLPFMKTWFDIVSAAAQGGQDHLQAGNAMMSGFHGWLKHRLPEGEEEPDALAAAMLTLVEGIAVMDKVGQREMADIAMRTLFPK